MERQLNELKEFFEVKFSAHEASLKNFFEKQLESFKQSIENEFHGKLQEQEKKINELESQNHQLRSELEELETYGRRLCLRIDGVPVKNNETSDQVLTKVESLCKDAEVDIPECIIDRHHRIGKPYYDKVTKNQVKSIIVRFATFRHRTLFYRAKNKMENVKVKIDLTKARYNLLKQANEYVKNMTDVKFCYADVNCRLKVKWVNESRQDNFFGSMKELSELFKPNSSKIIYF